MRRPWLVRGDIDGFFGLFIDNLLQLMLIAGLCAGVCKLPQSIIVGRILPGAAFSILIGNLFYAWQARQLMARTGRDDITALPYGINTPSLVAYIFLIMAPIQERYHDPELTWRVGLFACFLSGVMETAGAFVGDWLRKHTPRAALLSALAGIAITFIAMDFVFQIFASPAVAIFPMALILVTYAARLKLPLGLPGGLIAVVIGVAVAWIGRLCGATWFQPPTDPAPLGFYPPIPAFTDALSLLTHREGWQFLSVIIPMGLFNVIGSLQNLESAEAAGDRYETRPSLLANGIGSLAAAFFGSAFPTTIYIGHPGWKAMGARAGYSTLNGIAIAALCLFGGIGLVMKVVPIEAALGILVWIAIIITAQSFREVPPRHALAVALGLMPALAAWALHLIESALSAAGSSLYKAVGSFAPPIYINGVIALNQGFMLSSMVLASILVFVIERRFLRAAGWAFVAGGLSMIGLIHAYRLDEKMGVLNRFGVAAAPQFALVYALVGLMLLALHFVIRPDDEVLLPTEARQDSTVGSACAADGSPRGG